MIELKIKSFMKTVIKIVLTFCFGIFITSCSSDKKSQIIIDETTVVEDFIIEEDTTMVKVLNLPIHIDSTQYIYHPTSLLYAKGKNKRRGFSISKRSYNQKTSSSNYSHYKFNGKYAGFAVENLKTGKTINITDQEISFSNVRIYNKLEYNPRVEFVLYEGYDLDTNKDGKLDYRDLPALFISNLDGSGFKKLTVDFEEYQSYTFIVENDKLYFQTIKDNNNDGTYENVDEYRNYVVNLKDSIKIATRYDNRVTNN